MRTIFLEAGRPRQPPPSGLVDLPPPLDILAGPLTPIGSTDYDTMYLTQAAIWEAALISEPNTAFYDGALVYYLLYYRTGDPRWVTRADYLAHDAVNYQMSIAPYVGNGALDGSGRSTLAGKDYTTLSMAIYYLRTGYSPALSAVRAQASGGNWYRSPYDPGNENANTRDASYGLMAMLTSTLLGGDTDWSTSMTTAVDSFMTNQGVDLVGGQSNDAWPNNDSGAQIPALQAIENFMNGLVIEALIMYDRMIGDSRIVPAIKRAVDWMWSTQWVALGGGPSVTTQSSGTSNTIGTGSKTFTTAAGLPWSAGQVIQAFRDLTDTPGGGVYDPTTSMVGVITSYSGTTVIINFTVAAGSGTYSAWGLDPAGYPGDQSAAGIGTMQYGNVVSGTVSKHSGANYTNLMGMEVPAWGYLYSKGQGPSYKANGDTLLAACQQSVFFGNTKAFNQMFRCSARYLGFIMGG